MTTSLQSRLFKRFFIPGLVIELLVLLCVFLPESINPLHNLSFLKTRVGGPAGWKVGFVLLPLQLQTIFFFFIAIFYSIRLPILYKKGNPKYIKASRNFMIFGDITIIGILIQIIALFCRLSAQDIEGYVNLPVVMPIFAAGFVMCAFFIYWTVVTYKIEGLKFFSKETLKSIGNSIVLFVCAALVLVAYIVILYLISEASPGYIERIN